MINGGTLDDFQSMPARLVGERSDRIERASRLLKYHVAFFDDYLRGLLPHDLVLIGAPTGIGKTQLALSIACSNAFAKRRVNYFALEAEPRELERRTKYALLCRDVYASSHPDRHQMNYTDWLLGRCEAICGRFNDAADEKIMDLLGGLHTYYRGAKFSASTLEKQILAVHERSDLIVVDHLHYVDADNADESEHKSLGDTTKTIRDVSLRVGVPIILVAHMRKRDQRAKQLVATLDDFHGSSNITKIATQVIAIERAYSIESPKWYLSPTFLTIPKDRRSGSPGLVALCNFDRRTSNYQDHYALGVAKGQEWDQLSPGNEIPTWAKHHKFAEAQP